MEERLELQSAIGFNGAVPKGLHVHPDRDTLVFPLGCTVVLESIRSGKQQFLHGHASDVSCIAVSHDGSLIAAGNQTYMGFQAEIIVWDFETGNELNRLKLHKVKVQDIAFSPSDRLLASLGGEDDGTVALWDLEKGKAISGAAAVMKSSGAAECLAFSSQSDHTFITGGAFNLRVWDFSPETGRVTPTDCQLGALRRVVKVIEVDANDEHAYCGTSTGDIVCINLKTRLLKSNGPSKGLVSNGISSLKLLKNGEILVGGGAGSINVIRTAGWRTLRKCSVKGNVSSVALRGDGHEFFVGTSQSTLHRVGLAELEPSLVKISHPHAVNDVVFAPAASELFATCSVNDIRVWLTATRQELLRIEVPGKVCTCIVFRQDGGLILSGWDDGVIRGFLPESGKKKFEIVNAHNKGVTALACSNDSTRLISGGGDGVVRSWKLGASSQTLETTLKEHKGKVTDIRINHSDTECVSASADGTCIVWDLTRFVRSQILFANTNFTQVCYRPDEAQVVTVGSDKKVGYWEVYDGTLIRDVEVSTATVNGLDVASDGNHFAVGGIARLVKVLSYNEAETTHIGIGHSGDVTKLRISSDQRVLVSTSTDGAIFVWNFPFAL
eukprot:m.12474 g.12474  ORF g.12474 m.12474 type:complete len:611 (-) comp4265_c0_seq1:143-1975(-)